MALLINSMNNTMKVTGQQGVRLSTDRQFAGPHTNRGRLKGWTQKQK